MFNALKRLLRIQDKVRAQLAIGLVTWEEIPESDEAPDTLTVTKSELMPSWAWNAMVRKDIMPVPEPYIGQMDDWGGDGVRVVKTDQFFPLGSEMHRSALS